MELVIVVSLGHLFDQGVQSGDRPAVERQHILRGDQPVRIKTVEVSETVAGRVAELQIVLAELLEHALVRAHIHMVVGGAGPETNHIGAEFLDEVGRVNAVAERFVHRAALLVHGPAVGQAFAVGGALAERADSRQQARLEPAAVLVAALEIHVGRPEALVALHRGEVARAGVKPAVERVGLFRKVPAAAVRADKALGQQLGRLAVKPGVAAVLFINSGNGFDRLVGADGLAAVLAIEHRDRQSPAALAGDAPVGALADHGDHALLAPGRQPFHVVAGADSLVLKGLDRAEPLRGRAEDDRALAAPAVGIAVRDLRRGEETARGFHVGQDDRIRLVGLQSGVLAGIVGVAALIVHGDDQLGAVAHAGFIVVGAKAGRGVHAAGAVLHRDIVRVHNETGFVEEGVARLHILEEGAGMGLNDLIAVKAADLHDLLHQRLGQNIALAVGGFDNRIALVRVQGDADIAGQRPDRRGPDQEEETRGVQMGEPALVVAHGKLHIDGRAGVVLVFDLSLGESGFILGAPVDGLESLVDIALLVHPPEDPGLLGLEALVHGLIGVLPVAQDAETPEAGHLALDVLFRIVVAGAAKVGDGHGLVVELLFLNDSALDRHTVVVPAGDIGRVIAAHRIRADNEVLDGLVERVAHVNIAVGKRRAVVQGEAGMPLVLFQKLVIDVLLVPGTEHVRLALGQSGAHRKVGFRQVQRGIIILGHWYPILLNL